MRAIRELIRDHGAELLGCAFAAEGRAKKKTSRLLLLFGLAVAGTVVAGYFLAVFALRAGEVRHANRYRADLRVRGLGKGCHGFAVALPEGFAGEIIVRRALDGAVLALVEAAQAA